MSSKMMNFGAFMQVWIEKGYTLDNWLDELRAVVSDTKTLANALKASFTSGLMSAPTLAIGNGGKTAVANGLFYYMIAGTIYAKALDAVGTAPGNDVVPDGTFGAVAFDIGIDGTIHAIEAAANATGYSTAVLAIAGIPAVSSAHVRMGTVTAKDTGAAFTFGTVALDHGGATVAYTDGAVGIAIGGTTVSSDLPFEFTP
jgi:hypothetical protein